MKFLENFGQFGSIQSSFDKDFADRLNCEISGIILIVSIAAIYIREFLGVFQRKSVQCFIPQEFTRGWENYCGTSNTYFSSFSLHPTSTLSFHQWAPVLLVGQACLLFLPYLLWQLLQNYSGINIRRVTQMVREAHLLPNITTDVHDIVSSRRIRYLARYIDSCIYQVRGNNARTTIKQIEMEPDVSTCGICGAIGANNEPAAGDAKSSTTNLQPKPQNIRWSNVMPSQGSTIKSTHQHTAAQMSDDFVCCLGQQNGNVMTPIYLTTKIFYVVNCALQLFALEMFVGRPQSFYAARILINVMRGDVASQNTEGNLPRVTFCDLPVKRLRRIGKYTLQCLLPINIFLEKLCVLLWFWYVFVSLITLFSIAKWLFCMVTARRRTLYIQKYLIISGHLQNPTECSESHRFAHRYLCTDLVLLIHFISQNVSDVLACDLTGELWNIYRHTQVVISSYLPTSQTATTLHLPVDQYHIQQQLYQGNPSSSKQLQPQTVTLHK